jgi:uncharacterized membrane protein
VAHDRRITTAKGRTVADKRLIISIFDAEADADEAAAALRHTGAVVDDAIGILVLDKHGKLKTHKVGASSGGKGAAAGAVVGLIGGPLGLGVSMAGGALLGKLHHKDIGLDDAQRDRLAAALRDGKAAVGVLADPDEVIAVESLLVGRGGETDAHELDAAILREAAEGA